MVKSSYKPKTTRQSRRQRMLYAIASPSPNFKPTPADWEQMESAYASKIEENDRKKIAKLVTDYFYLGQFGRNAPFVDDAEAWLAKVQKAAEGVQSNLGVLSKEIFSDEQTENGAEIHARYRIEQHLKVRHWWPQSAIEYIQEMLKDHLNAIAHTAKELETAGIWPPIEEAQFAMLIRGLTDWAESRDPPTGASKGANKSPNDKPSAFVAFVRELQSTFPIEYQRHATSDVALAKAISDARREKARDLKSKVCEVNIPPIHT